MIIAEMTASFPCESGRLFSIMTDNEHYEWRSDLKKIDIVDPGVRFVEYTKDDFPTFFTVIEKKKNRLYAFKLENNNLKGKWFGKLKDDGTSTILTLKEEIEVKRPLLRLLAPLYLKKQQKRYIEDLKDYLSLKGDTK